MAMGHLSVKYAGLKLQAVNNGMVHGYGNWQFMNVIFQDLQANEEVLIEDNIFPKVFQVLVKIPC